MSTPSRSPFVDPLPPDDPLIVKLRRRQVASCRHRIVGETVYSLATPASGECGWVFAHRAGVGYVFDGVDDPRGLFAALTVEAGPVDAMVQSLVEAFLLDHFRSLSRPRPAGEPPVIAPEPSPRELEEFTDLGLQALRLVRRAFPEAVPDIALEQMWSHPGVSPSVSPGWSERPLGDYRLSALLRDRTQDLLAESLAMRASGLAAARAAEVRRNAQAGQGPEMLALLTRRAALEEADRLFTAAAKVETAADVAQAATSREQAHAAELRKQAQRPAVLNRLLGVDPDRLLPMAQDADGRASDLQQQASSLYADADRWRLTAHQLTPDVADPGQELQTWNSSWDQMQVQATRADLDGAEREAARLTAEAGAHAAEAVARKQRADTAADELTLRASLPQPLATVEFLDREAHRALTRTHPAGRTGRALAPDQRRQPPPPAPGSSPGRRP